MSDLVSPLWSQRQGIGINNALALDQLVSFSLRLLRLLLVELFDNGSFQFRDTRVPHALFSLHTVMYSTSHSGIFQLSAHEVQYTLLQVNIILFFFPLVVDSRFDC